ncbi:hypothetical protein C8Q74DRAFT_1445969 [Fomes fomentarius]|nr:hypothetical protein C8Q74DRAFT_1445969 [Fomes fomentarius]
MNESLACFLAPAHLFLARIPGSAPQHHQCEAFEHPDLTHAKTTSSVYSQFTSTSASVFESIPGANHLQCVDTAVLADHHGSRACDSQGDYEEVSEYINFSTQVGGIYLVDPTTMAGRVTNTSVVHPRSLIWDHLTVAVLISNGDMVLYEDHIDKVSYDHYEINICEPSSDEEDCSVVPKKQSHRNHLFGLFKAMHRIFTHQHRTFSYAVDIADGMCRLAYVDRSGTLVSYPFNWTSTTSPLHTFLWKIAQLTPAQLGYDPTVTLASSLERERFIGMSTDPSLPDEVWGLVRCAVEDSSPIYKLRVTTNHTPTKLSDRDVVFANALWDAAQLEQQGESSSDELHVQEFIVGRPHSTCDSLFGQGTRCFIALRLDIKDGNKLCLLKDYWRSHVPSRPEHLVYQRLHRERVPFVATLICGGDVGGPGAQTTEVQECLFAQDPQSRHVARIHYRICVEEIGLPLTDFKNFKELSYIFILALQAHHSAWTRAGVLHRDISIDNIMIHPETRKALLINWDLSRLASELSVDPVEPDRSGTWQFQSALILQYPRKPYRLYDDLESFVHLFRNLVLRFHHTNASRRGTLAELVTSLFDSVSRVGGALVGGHLKLEQFKSPKSPFLVINNSALQAVLDALAQGCYSFYAQVTEDHMEATYGVLDDTQEDTMEPYEVAFDMDGIEQDWFEDSQGGPQTKIDIEESTQPSDDSHNGSGDVNSDDDPCDIEGYLSEHKGLANAFHLFSKCPARNDKTDDLFRLCPQ